MADEERGKTHAGKHHVGYRRLATQIRDPTSRLRLSVDPC
jgi:hypothetical protein